MKLLNQRGMSLVEVMVGMAVMVAGSAMYALHSKNVAKNEASLKVRSTITQMGMEAVDYLKSREICDSNMGAAFKDLPLAGPATDLSGKSTYKKLRGKIKDIYTVDQNFDNGKIWVKNVDYKLENLKDVTIPNAPWSKSGDMKITVTFQRCASGGPVYRINNGVKTVSCPHIVETNQVINKMAALKIDSGKVSQFACADSQDALIDAANKFTQEKFCFLEAKMRGINGMEGTTPAPCNYTVTLTDVVKESGEVVIPASIVPKSLKIRMIGGGGGGGGGDKTEPGKGGGAGHYHEQDLDDNLIGATCELSPGAGGGGGDGGGNATSGGKGGNSFFACSRDSRNKTLGFLGLASWVQKSLIAITKEGGNGGEGEGCSWKDTSGDNGANAVDPRGALLGGGGGGGGEGKDGGNGGPGAGGGGGGDEYGEGGKGGDGFVKLSWKELVIKDASGNEIPL